MNESRGEDAAADRLIADIVAFLEHHDRFGPWACEHDPLLDSLAAGGAIELKSIGDDREALLVKTLEPQRDLTSLSDVGLQMAMSRVLTGWGRVPLPEILDFVYFETEPDERRRARWVTRFLRRPAWALPRLHARQE